MRKNLNEVSGLRRRNKQIFSIKRKVDMSPGRADIGDFLETQQNDNDESKRVKRLFFETYIGDKRKHMNDENGKPSIVELKQLA